MYGYMGRLPGVLLGYLSTYDSFRKTAGFVPAEQEVVFLTISRTNGCTYCMAAHSMIADKMSGVAPDVLAALRAGQILPDAKAAIVFLLYVTDGRNPRQSDQTCGRCVPCSGIRRATGSGHRPCHRLQDLLELCQSLGKYAD